MTDVRTLVLLSGGLDSTSVLARAIHREPARVAAVSFDYGQRHVRELESARAVANYYDVEHMTIDLSSLAGHLHSALTGHLDVPHGHYASENMRQTVVPNRNAIMLMVAVGVASSMGANVVETAVHAGDHAIYPDCRPEFVGAIAHAAELGTQGFGDVTVTAPFAYFNKWEVLTIGHRHNAPLAMTWSCYEGGATHCGRCGTCVERAEAFFLAGVPDPTAYADASFWRDQVKA